MGFGKHALDRGQIVVGAVEKAGVRAVVATGWGGLELDSLPDVCTSSKQSRTPGCSPGPSAWFTMGGAGTTAAGLLAARPTLVCPVLGDRFQAQRVKDLGVGPHRCRCVD